MSTTYFRGLVRFFTLLEGKPYTEELLMRGIRGATQIQANTVRDIEDGVAELCRAISDANAITQDDIGWAIFTVTHDLDADFPARAAREAGGWTRVPMICSREIPVPGSLPRAIRVLVHVDSGVPAEARHVYLRGAKVLRPDLSQ
ncbi:MAG TPA: chorismate mutase [Anaeromyxobacteraceae bacterium]|nr:chorismate mutase [Anaeromyxobacteraceae bacterium]